MESATDKKLQKLVDSSYIDTAWMFLSRGKENAIALLKSYPQIFVQFIGVYMLAFFAPRIKRKKFYKEEETRIILSIPPQEYAHFVYILQTQSYKRKVDYELIIQLAIIGISIYQKSHCCESLH